MSNLRELVISNHIRHNHPNAKIVSWDDPDSQLRFYTAEELQNVEEDWFPLCCRLDPDTGKAVYGGLNKIVHTYTEGETGAGKTTRFAMQSIRALSCLRSKPSFVVVDIHGELVENLYNHLRGNGYEVKILNCDDPSRSDTYNPFAPMVARCQESGSLDHETLSEIRKIAEIIQPVNSTQDPIWDQGARAYTNGAILDKFEDLLADNIPPHCITLYNIIQNHYWLRKEISRHPGMSDLLRIPHYRDKGATALSVQKLISVINNAERTRASYFGVVENHYDAFGQPSLYQLSSNSTIDIRAFIEKPTAIFIQSGSTRIGDDLISLLVNEIYNTSVRMGKASATKMLPRKIHCFLDEFANSNIAEGPEFIKMLTTSRKFGMYWHMLLQSDAQLERKFDQNMARIIRSNCTEIFMGSHDYDTILRFARSCGQKTVEALSSQISQQVPMLETVDLMTADRLSLTEEGYVYVKLNRRPLLYSYIEAFFNCPEFVPVEDLKALYPVNDFCYENTAYFPDDIPPRISDMEFQVLRHIHEHNSEDVFRLEEMFPALSVQVILDRLEKLDLIIDDEEHDRVVSKIGNNKMREFEARHPNVPRPDVPAPKEEEPEESGEDPKARGDGIVTRNQLLHAIHKALQAQGIHAARTEAHLRPFTCIPDRVKQVFCQLAEHAPEEAEIPARFFTSTLHFEILETFISRHDFETKEEWHDALRKEYAQAVANPIFPREFTLLLGKALRELDELTLGNIQEVKRIIGSGEES